MKILLVHNYYVVPGGEDEVVKSKINMLLQRGHQVVLYSRDNREIDSFSLRKKIKFFLKEAYWSEQTHRELKELIRKERPDFAHFHNTFYLITPSAYQACREEGIPIIQTLHNYRFLCPVGTFWRPGKGACDDCLKFGRKSAVINRCWKGSYFLSAFLVGVVNRYHKNDFIKNCIDRFLHYHQLSQERFEKNGFPADKFSLNNPFLDFDPGVSSQHLEYGLFVGGFFPYKGIETLLKAWIDLKEGYPLKLIGDGPLFNELRLKYTHPNIEFLGYKSRNETMAYIKKAFFVVLPSECYEMGPRVIIEAYACGVPVIVSSMISFFNDKDKSHEGKCGLLFKGGDSKDLAEKIKYCYASPQKVREMGQMARESFHKNYTVDEKYKQLMKVYTQVLEKRSSPQAPLCQFNVQGVNISAVNLKRAFSQIDGFIQEGGRRYVCVAPVSTIVSCQEDKDYKNVINEADMVTPDGMPLVWLARMKGYKNVSRTYGPDLMQTVCQGGIGKKYRHFFYGATPEVCKKLEEKLKERYPGIMIAGKYSPPFRELSSAEEQDIAEMINKTQPDIVWVGLGSPKQDFWMKRNRGKLNASVLIGVGAAFDFLSGVKPQAPRWMQRTGLEWLFRLACEPKRLWRRYLIGNTKFIYLVIKDMLRQRTV